MAAQELVVLLNAAYFGAGPTRSAAEAALLAALPRPGAASALVAIAAAPSLSDDVRVAAVLALKQTVGRFWKGGEAKGGTGLGEADKTCVRDALLPLLDAPPHVSAQVAHVLAAVARHDFPAPWGSLLEQLAGRLRDTGSAGAVRGLSAVLATLVSMRLPAARTTVSRLTPPLLSLLAPRLAETLAAGARVAAEEAGAWVAGRGEQGKLELRSVARLLKHTRLMSENGEAAAQVLSLLAASLPSLLAAPPAPPALAAWRAWTAGKVNRTLHAALELHPLAFPLSLLASHLEFCAAHVGAPAVAPNHPLEAFRVACVLFLKTAADNSSFKLVPEAAAQRAAAAAFFTHERLAALSEALVRGPLVLTPDELDEWRASPEAYIQEDDADMWRVRLKHAAEAALLVLAHPVLAAFLPWLQAQLAAAPADASGVLAREAVYRAAGTLAPLLAERFDFGAWFAAALQHDLQPAPPPRAILARRACQLVGAFATAGAVRSEHRPLLYERMVQTMGAYGDLVVRVAAAEALKALVFDVAFEAAAFAPYLGPCLHALFALLHLAAESDTQLRVLLILETVLAQLAGPSLVPHTESLLRSLSDAWTKAGTAHLVRSSVLRILSALVQTLGPASHALYDFLLPLVRVATALGSTDELYLLDDGLDLWRELLAVAPALHPALLALYPAVTALLARGYEQVGACTRIMELYLLLGQGAFLAEHGAALVATLTQMVGDVKDEGLLLALRVADTFIQLVPAALPALAPLLAKCLAAVLRDADAETPAAVRHHLALLARALLANPPVFVQLLEQAGAGAAAALMDVWGERLDTMDAPFMRKLIALALARMLVAAAHVPGVVGRAGLVVASVTSALADAEGAHDHFVVLAQDEPGPEDAAASRERSALYSRDPVNALSLRTAAVEALREASGRVGETQVMASVDATLLDALLHPPPPPNPPA